MTYATQVRVSTYDNATAAIERRRPPQAQRGGDECGGLSGSVYSRRRRAAAGARKECRKLIRAVGRHAHALPGAKALQELSHKSYSKLI